MGDESEAMVARYIGHSILIVARKDSEIVGVCAVTREEPGWVEVKNLAVHPDHRREGIGRDLLYAVERMWPATNIKLGTGETPSTLLFYKKCGFRVSHTVPDFFTLNYPHPIVEEGVTLKDMIYLVKT